MLLASSDSVKKGETFTIDVYAQNVAGLNAFGQVINYDNSKNDDFVNKRERYICRDFILSI